MAGSLTAVAMSGGLDSSVSAWLLSHRGDPVIGLSMLLWDRSDENHHGRCCGGLDLGDARRVAQQCGFPHYTLRMDEEFRTRIVDPFVHDYLAGRTPSPCVRCNTWVKFDLLLQRARHLGAQRLATGHYARIVKGDDGFELHTALDRSKDQSYFLFELTQEQLAAARFPLGERTKQEVRALARQAELVVSEKRESMEICFVSSGIRDFVEDQIRAHPKRFPEAPSPPSASRIVDIEGQSLGHGQPYYRYTVGQRRGLGIAAGERLYVLAIEATDNRVTVGPATQLEAEGLVGRGLHWIGSPPAGDLQARVKIRSRHGGVRSRIRPLARGRVEIEFETPQRGVTPGQAAVFYQDTRVLGGCWIEGQLSRSK